MIKNTAKFAIFVALAIAESTSNHSNLLFATESPTTNNLSVDESTTLPLNVAQALNSKTWPEGDPVSFF